MMVRQVSRGVVAILLAFELSHASAQAQAPTGRETSAASVASYALSEEMPVDPEVLVGGLPNGLRFYVRPNGKPAKQVELRLVVKASRCSKMKISSAWRTSSSTCSSRARRFPGSVSPTSSARWGRHRRDANAGTASMKRYAAVPSDSLAPSTPHDGARRLPAAPPSNRPGSIASGQSSSPSGAGGWAPASGPKRSCEAWSSRDRGTWIDRRLARRR